MAVRLLCRAASSLRWGKFALCMRRSDDCLYRENMIALLGDPAMRCLGDFQLKGLDTPETLYEVLPQALSGA